MFHPALNERTLIRLPLPYPDPNAETAHKLLFAYSPSSPLAEGTTVEVWTSLPSSSASPEEWQAIRFLPFGASSSLLLATIPLPHGTQAGTYEYTYRFRHINGEVEWLGWEGGNGVVELLSPSSALPSSIAEECPVQFGPGVEIRQEEGAVLASFRLPEGKSDDVSSFPLPLGRGRAEEWNGADVQGLVLERSERTWFVPRLLPSPSPLLALSPTFDTQLLYLHSPRTGQILVVYPLSTSLVSASLRGGEGSAWVRCTRDSPDPEAEGEVAISWGREGELRECVERCVALGRRALDVPSQVERGLKKDDDDIKEQSLRACTWNALGMEHYTLSKVLKWLDGLKNPARTSPLFAQALDTILLDDGWQDTERVQDGQEERRRLRSFGVRPEWFDLDLDPVDAEARVDAEGKETRRDDGPSHKRTSSEEQDGVLVESPGGELKCAVARIKALGVQRVGVWMTVAGYWDGLSPTGPLATTYGPLVRWTLSGAPTFPSADTHWHLPPLARLPEYYMDYFRQLKAQGVDFVKVDDQAHLDYLVSGEGGEDAGEVRATMLRCMRCAADEVFGVGTTVHCMSGTPRTVGGELGLSPGKGGVKSVYRNSDDFFPNDANSHPFHLFANAHTTLLTRSLALLPDFDMCQERTTDSTQLHPWGSAHIAFRAFSPAPTYSTDVPAEEGLRDALGWEKLLGWTREGAGVVKTMKEVGAVLEGRIGEEVRGEGEGAPLLVGLEMYGAGGAHLGAWNIRAGGVRAMGTVSEKDVAEALGRVERGEGGVVIRVEGEEMREVSSERLEQSRREHRLLARPVYHLGLGDREFSIATIAALHSLSSSSSSDGIKIACLGLLDKHAGLAAISSLAVIVPSSPSTSPVARLNPSPIPSPSIPRPRLAFLLTCLTSYRTSSSSSGSRGWAELHSLGRDFLRQPVRTVWTELRAMMGFALAVVWWGVGRVVGSRRGVGTPSLGSAQKEEEEEQAQASGNPHLRVELQFVSPKLGFYVLPIGQSVEFKLDGVRVDARFVRVGASEGMVEVDVEGAWRTEGAGGKGSGWVLEVEQGAGLA